MITMDFIVGAMFAGVVALIASGIGPALDAGRLMDCQDAHTADVEARVACYLDTQR